MTDTLTVTGDDGREFMWDAHPPGKWWRRDGYGAWEATAAEAALLAEVVRLRASVTDLESKLVRECGATMSWAKRVAEVEREQWVPVSERLPEVGERVLIGTASGQGQWYDGMVEVGNFFVDGWDSDDDEALPYTPTHWMPLPAPPKGGTP